MSDTKFLPIKFKEVTTASNYVMHRDRIDLSTTEFYQRIATANVMDGLNPDFIAAAEVEWAANKDRLNDKAIKELVVFLGIDGKEYMIKPTDAGSYKDWVSTNLVGPWPVE